MVSGGGGVWANTMAVGASEKIAANKTVRRTLMKPLLMISTEPIECNDLRRDTIGVPLSRPWEPSYAEVA